jgi:hypothetical protein
MTNKTPTYKMAAETNPKLSSKVPKIIRMQFKIELSQILKVGVNAIDTGKGNQFFYTKMAKDGRIHISKLIILILQGENPLPSFYLPVRNG